MLSNKDFKSLLATPSSNSSNNNSNNKVRYDLKQISAWDKQINEKLNNINSKSNKQSRENYEINKDKSTDHSSSYRDRALERRKGDIDENEEKLQSIIKTLDIEQSKFLGGDIEHTHLVKGLDYALLRKTKESSKLRDDKTINHQINLFDKTNSDVKTISALGEQIKQLLLPSDIENNKKMLLTKKVFQHLSFQFNLNDDSNKDDSDLPTNITTSKQVYKNSDLYTNFSLSNDIINKVKEGFETSKLNMKLKKKSSNAIERNSIYKPEDLIVKEVKPKESIDIYGGLLQKSLGSYSVMDIVLSSNNSNIMTSNILLRENENPSIFNNKSSENLNSSIMNISVVKELIDSDDESNTKNLFNVSSKLEDSKANKNDDLMAPVKALLKAQHDREITKQNYMTNKSNHTITVDKNLIHRSAFDVLDDAVEYQPNTNKTGIAMGKGTFDIFSETKGFEAYDSDLDDEEDVGIKKSSKRLQSNENDNKRPYKKKAK